MVTAGVVVAVLVEETVMLAGMRLKSIGAFCCFEGVAIVVAKNSAFLLNVVGAATNSWRGGGERIIHIPSVPWIMAVSRKGAVITSGVCILPLVAPCFLVTALAHRIYRSFSGKAHGSIRETTPSNPYFGHIFVDSHFPIFSDKTLENTLSLCCGTVAVPRGKCNEGGFY
ncbi:hypothetical protein WUBG_06495 [Wuchereria bancrofti]|uniref:Uncharacterized protein n=1 Tax=Wuchereria bancrofti TaxID=6293 RepID=J9EJJ2_WUCBA|nr:hypothetical protein WUBG_06495 [Wuchereria bancrofti]